VRVASLITHPVIPVAVALALGRKVIPVRLMVLGMVFAMLPDLDSITFRLGIAYGSPFGHRGAAHSIAAAAACAMLVLPLSATLGARPLLVFGFLAGAMISHGVLDAMTNAGKGVAFFWPFSNERIFFDVRPIEVSPVSVRRFLAPRGLQVLRSELLWVWVPVFTLASIAWLLRRQRHTSAR
jgi:inner membrane protein